MFSAVIFDIHAGERSERDGKAQQRRAVSAQPRDSRPYLGIMPKIFFFDTSIILAAVYSNSMGAGSRAYPPLPLTVVTTVSGQLANSRVIIYDRSF